MIERDETLTYRYIDRVEVSKSNHRVRKIREVEGVVEAEALKFVFYYPDPALSPLPPRVRCPSSGRTLRGRR